MEDFEENESENSDDKDDEEEEEEEEELVCVLDSDSYHHCSFVGLTFIARQRS